MPLRWKLGEYYAQVESVDPLGICKQRYFYDGLLRQDCTMGKNIIWKLFIDQLISLISWGGKVKASFYCITCNHQWQFYCGLWGPIFKPLHVVKLYASKLVLFDPLTIFLVLILKKQTSPPMWWQNKACLYCKNKSCSNWQEAGSKFTAFWVQYSSTQKIIRHLSML